jgi:hypothetical protein
MSTIKTETLSTPSNATVPVDTVVNGTAKAWVNFNGTGTVAIRRAFNVSSITDNGTGSYTVNFTTAMPDANYSTTTAVGFFSPSSAVRVVAIHTALAGSVQLSCIVTTNIPDDRESINAAIFR